jgi:hypothetical protein
MLLFTQCDFSLFLCLFMNGFLFHVDLFCLRSWKRFAYSKMEHNSGHQHTVREFAQMDPSLEIWEVTCVVEATRGKCVNMGSTDDYFNSTRFDNDDHYCDESRLRWVDFLAQSSVVCTIYSVRITLPFLCHPTVHAVINQVI